MAAKIEAVGYGERRSKYIVRNKLVRAARNSMYYNNTVLEGGVA